MDLRGSTVVTRNRGYCFEISAGSPVIRLLIPYGPKASPSVGSDASAPIIPYDFCRFQCIGLGNPLCTSVSGSYVSARVIPYTLMYHVLV
ncbi:hypothetical protein GQ457_03G023450 [Hibiscus cannabinus]